MVEVRLQQELSLCLADLLLISHIGVIAYTSAQYSLKCFVWVRDGTYSNTDQDRHLILEVI
jgi:hypothetical protein